jgi:hypothetical protein
LEIITSGLDRDQTRREITAIRVLRGARFS